MPAASLRREDGPLLRGEGRFVADLRLPGLLHAIVVRSPYARGLLRGVELAAVRAAPGVVDAFAAADIAPLLAPIPSRLPLPAALEGLLQPPLAGAEVRYAGQPLAVVVAASPEAAQDAADLAVARIEPLDPEPEAELHREQAGFGDLDAAFAGAEVVVRETFRIARQAALPLETRGLVARFGGGTLEVWTAAKAPRHQRDVVSAALGLDPGRVRYLTVDAGGGFGVRGELHPEDLLVPIASLRTGRPVRWTEERLEHLQAAYQSRDLRWEAAIAVAADGELLALDGDARSDLGAYVGPNGLTVGRIALKALAGPYRLRAYRCSVGWSRSAKAPLGTMRGPGHLEASFVRERLVDLAAGRLGADPVELRRRNLVRPGEMPFETGLDGVVLDGGDYAAGLDRAVGALTARPARGLGVACVVEGAGMPGVERARARREADGRFTVVLGSASFGQGHATTFARVAAGALGVEPESVDVVEGDTVENGTGGGTFASRTAVMTGNAVRDAAAGLRAALERELDGAVVEAEGEFVSTGATFTFGAAAAVVAVDAETGGVSLLELAVAADVGAALEPAAVHGQLAGGAAHGAGGALFEHLAYEDGLPLTGGLRDYHVPRALDLPPIRTIVVESPSPGNPLGVRGVGEVAVAAAAAAVANAVADAGGRATSLPLLHEAVAG